MSTIKTVLFDVGNVLTHDGHDTYLLHAQHGIARDIDLSEEEIRRRTAVVFRKYAILEEAKEADFWQEICEALETHFSEQIIEQVKQNIQYINPESETVFKYLQDNTIAIGVISNSTPFLYPILADKLRLDSFVDPDLYFLSHVEGRLKSSGLFEIAASKVHPPETLIIDDRIKNVEYAKRLGFQSEQYVFEDNESLLALVKQKVL